MISFLPRDELNIPFIDFGFRVTENKLEYYVEGSCKFSEKFFMHLFNLYVSWHAFD